MASLLSLLYLTVLSVLFSFFFCFIHASSSEVVLPLTHSYSETQFQSTHHLLKASTVRSTTRFHHHKNHKHHHSHRQVSLPLSPGSDYTLSFSLGSKKTQKISLYMDTGSDLVWFPCAPFECILCEGKYDTNIPIKPPNVSSSASVPCGSPLCSSVHSSVPSSDLCSIAKCPLEDIETSDCNSFSCPPFYYAYADGSFIARLYRDHLSFPISSPSTLHMENFTFGCAHEALAEPIGVAGFGRGKLSLPAQLSSVSPHLGNRFSYCLISHSFDVDKLRKPSPLILGRSYVGEEEKQRQLGKNKKKNNNGGEEEDQETGFLYTPMLENPKHPYFYCVGLEGISIGKKRISTTESLKRVSRNGRGGMVVDSGTTFTMLPSKLYESVNAEFSDLVDRVYERATGTEERTGLSPCYYYDDTVVKRKRKIPKMVFHFGGNVSVVLPQRNYFFGFDGGDVKEKRKVGCLMLMNGGDEAESSGPAATLGNYQQQGFEVVYDLEKKKVGFARKQCASLWDNLNKR